MQTITLKAPAKINLYLRVLDKRADGFHNIETIFEKINLCDELTLTLKKSQKGIRVISTDKRLPQDGRNLAYQAAQTWFKSAGRRRGLEIKIVKRIPIAAGLGGGSSDAAGVLLGLNRLFGDKLSQYALLEMGRGLGADVPFFIFPGSRAIGRGKGEILSSLRFTRKNWYVLVVPAIAVSTRSMYRRLSRIALTKKTPGVKITLYALEKGNLSSLNQCSYNSFESILVKKYKRVLAIKKALKSSGASATLISGSGPCVFGIAQTRKEAMQISTGLKAEAKKWQVIIAGTLDSKERNIVS